MSDTEKAIRDALTARPTQGPWLPKVFVAESSYDAIPSFYSSVISDEDYQNADIDAAYIAACNPVAITKLLEELDRLRQVPAQAVIAPAALLTKENRRDIYIFAWKIYRDLWRYDLRQRIAAVVDYSCSATEAVLGITESKEPT